MIDLRLEQLFFILFKILYNIGIEAKNIRKGKILVSQGLIFRFASFWHIFRLIEVKDYWAISGFITIF